MSNSEQTGAFARKTILVLAYSISPIRGSEYAVGWDYITNMSRDHDLIVLYGLAGDHMGDFDEVDDETKRSFGTSVSFVSIAPGLLARILNAPNRAGRFVYLFYLAYRMWHRQAAVVAKDICQARRVDVVHYLCPIGFREPGYLWRLDKPYIWGPVGGMPLLKWRLFTSAGKKQALRALLKNLLNWLQVHCSFRLRKAIRRADVLLAATSENAGLMRRIARVHPIFFPENGVRTIFASKHDASASDTLRLIWVGRIDGRKALSFCLRALAHLKTHDWHLDVIGWGPLAPEMQHLAERLGLDEKITWHKKQPRQTVLEMFSRADIHVLSSLLEAHSTVLWEAMAHGVPTVAFDHCGMHDSICEKCGVRVPIQNDQQMVRDLAVNLELLIADREKVMQLKKGAHACARQNSWAIRREKWNQYYDLAIARYEDRGHV